MNADDRARLTEMAEQAAGVAFGLAAFEARLEELAGGIPSRGGGGGKGTGASPIEALVISRSEGRSHDPAPHLAAEFSRRLLKASDAVRDLFESYAAVAGPRRGVEKMTNPGCELCARVEGHWCPVYGVVEVHEQPARKGGKPRTRVVKLCEWCYRFQWPSRVGRLPLYDEVLAHSEGRPVRATKGA